MKAADYHVKFACNGTLSPYSWAIDETISVPADDSTVILAIYVSEFNFTTGRGDIYTSFLVKDFIDVSTEAELIAAVESRERSYLNLTNDITLTEPLVIENSSIELKMNGFTLSGNPVVLKGSSLEVDGTLDADLELHLFNAPFAIFSTITDGIFRGDITSSNINNQIDGGTFYGNVADVWIYGGTFYGDVNAFEINNGTFYGTVTGIPDDSYICTYQLGNFTYAKTYRTFGGSLVQPDASFNGITITDGWYRDEACTQKWNFDTDYSRSNITLYAADWEDSVSPTITGIEDGKTYCSAPTVTVTDNVGIASVTVNGTVKELDNGSFSLSPAAGVQAIVVADKAGNQAEMTVIVNDGHTWEWKTENGQYWQTCKYCNHESEKNGVPTATIVSADTVCRTQDLTFTVVAPEGAASVDAGFDFSASGGPLNTNADGSYTVSAEWYTEGENSMELSAYITMADGYAFKVSKSVAIADHHTGGTATCTDKATCDICGEAYGELDDSNHAGALHHTEASAATQESNGNTEFWYCAACDRYYSDKDGRNEIRLADTVIDKLPKTDDTSTPPHTGDSNHLTLWFALLAISAAGVVGFSASGRKRKERT